MNMKQKWFLLLVALIALVGVSAACTTSPSGTAGGTTTTAPLPAFTCPVHGPNTIIFAGDSLVAQWPQYLSLPAGTVVYNVARGGANFTNSNTVQPQDSYNIGQRLLAQLDLCGDDVGLVALSGGINDLAVGQPPTDLEASVATLSAQLAARNIPVVWLPITPWAILTPWVTYDIRYDNRLAYNDWLRTPGNVTGDVLECNVALQYYLANPESLAPSYFSWLGINQPDRYHPNADGYKSFARCLSPLISSRLPN